MNCIRLLKNKKGMTEMKNIMKSIWFEIRHSKLMIRIYIVLVLFMALVGFLNTGASADLGTASTLVADDPTIAYEFSIFVVALVVGIICGEDYRDKVANYEVLSGHSRKSIFLARSLMGIITAAVLGTLLSFAPMITGIIKAGWGNELLLSDVIARQLLLFFPFLRLAAFLALLTFLIKNPYIMMAVGFVICMASVLLEGMLEHSKSVFISIFNMSLLTSYSGWQIYNLDPVKGIVKYSTYESSLSAELVIGTIVASLLMTGFYLFMGYALFRRDELN